MINTKSAARRKLRFESVDDLFAELDRIEDADQQGTLTTNGNWTAGQILSHLTAWIEYGYDGFPISRPPFPVRWLLQWMLPGMLRDGMRAGVKIPGVKGGTTGAVEVPTGEALLRYRAAVSRMQSEPAKYASPAFGPLSEPDRIRLQLRHAELHLSFLTLESDTLSSSHS
jgi:hypothetical protein